MSTSAITKSTASLQQTKDAVDDIRTKLQPVLDRLKDILDTDEGDSDHGNNRDPSSSHKTVADVDVSEIQATVALAVGMMRYISARLRGLDQGRSKDDPLREELNNMKRVLADIKKYRRTVVINNNKKDDDGDCVVGSKSPPKRERRHEDDKDEGSKPNKERTETDRDNKSTNTATTTPSTKKNDKTTKRRKTG